MPTQVKQVDVVRVLPGSLVPGVDRAAAEEPLEIRLHGRPFAVIMRTPGADRELAAGFLLFRTFDTLKPYPIWKMGYWKGAVGVLADDIGAAIAAAAILYGIGRLGWL